MSISIPENFRQVPGIPYFAVSEDGQALNLRSGKIATASKQKTGYRTVAVNVNKKTKTFYVHRLVAMTYIPIPESVLEKTNAPEVNHKDGNKDNNAKSNLEWVTSKQNKEHAIENYLFVFSKVLCKHVLTNEIVSEPSYHSCARNFGVGEKRLKRHLDSQMAGLITKDYWVFKYDNGSEWPEMHEDCIVENRWDNSSGIWVAEKDNLKLFSDTLAKVCEHIGAKYNTVQPEVRADGKTYTVVGWKFWYCSLPTKEMLAAVEFNKKTPEFKTAREIKCTHLKMSVTKTYPSLRSASNALGIADTTMLYALTKKDGLHDGYKFEYVTS